jgi:hypothetical protein
MSALGHKRTYAVQQPMSALLSIATAKAIPAKGDVCFTPKSGHVQRTSRCPLSANSGHGGIGNDKIAGASHAMALGKDTPLGRAVQRSGVMVAIPILSGLHRL